MLRFVVCLCLAACSISASADASLPSADVAGAQDPAGLGRYEGSLIVDYQSGAFDDISLPVGAMKPSSDEAARDSQNNRVYRADPALDLEGKLSRVIYLIPEGRSPLEVLRNYQEMLASKGATALYECKGEACGGDVTSGADHGGGEQGILSMVFPQDRVNKESFSNAACAVTMSTSDVRYAVVRIDANGASTHVAVYVYKALDDLYCKAFNTRSIAIVVTVEAKAREQKMVTLKASAMADAIAASGKVSLYGIQFDFDKATIKAESSAQIEEIASLLKQNADLKLMVVGHTDNQGKSAYNVDLSKRRADAVVAALTAGHGIAADRLLAQGMGSAAPLASNDGEDGRAKNRRVELVKQ